jgi:hypothetical protein
VTDLAKKVLVDPKPFWGGWVVGLIAAAVFVGFATWIVVQRVKQDRRNGRDE